MKRYEGLTEEQQKKALKVCTERLLAAICEGTIRFNDELNGDDLQARIEEAWADMERLQTPWFIGERIMETCRDEIEGMAQYDAEEALYAETEERVIEGVL